MKSPFRSDSRLVAQVLRGRADRYEPLVERYLPAVRAVAYGRVGNAADTDDVAQEAFVRAYEKLGELRDPDKFGPWLMSIARNCAVRVAERRGRERPLSPEQVEAAPADTPDIAKRERAAIVREHLAELPEPAREVLLLHYFAGHSTREIAGLLDLSQAAVLKRLQRARAELGVSLLGELGDDVSATSDVAQHAARITALATAAAAYNATTGGSVATAATAVPLLVKGTAAIVAAAAISAGAMFIAVSMPPNQGESATQPASPPIGDVVPPQSSAPVADAYNEPVADPLVVAQAPAESGVASDATTLEDATVETSPDASEVQSEETTHSLSGLWRFRVGDDDQDTLTDYGFMEITQTGSEFNYALAEDLPGDFNSGVGTVSGNRVTLIVSEQVVQQNASVTLSGEVNETWDEAVLRGALSDPSIPSGVVRIELERAEQREVDQHLLTATFRDEVEAMFDALRTWRAEHDGVYPDADTAKEVYGAVLPDDKVKREIAYAAVPTKLAYPEGLPRAENLRSDSTFYPDLPLPDRLVLLEQTLERAWDGGVGRLLEPVLAVRYPEHRLAYNAFDASGVVDARWDETDEVPAAQQPALRAACANNLKQLGLSGKMFVSEFRDYWPPGFNALYPNYLPDPNVLRCPAAAEPEISYELMFPAFSEDYMLAIGADYLGVDLEDVNKWSLESVVPYAFEKHDCATPGVRNVLFMDGHVTAMRDEDFEERVAPFFDYR